MDTINPLISRSVNASPAATPIYQERLATEPLQWLAGQTGQAAITPDSREYGNSGNSGCCRLFTPNHGTTIFPG